MAHVFDTSLEIQRVYLHEVNSVLNGNFLSQILTSLGAALLAMTYSFSQGSQTFTIPLWPFGIILFCAGAVAYWFSVYRVRKSWERRRIPIQNYNYNDSTRETKTAYP